MPDPGSSKGDACHPQGASESGPSSASPGLRTASFRPWRPAPCRRSSASCWSWGSCSACCPPAVPWPNRNRKRQPASCLEGRLRAALRPDRAVRHRSRAVPGPRSRLQVAGTYRNGLQLVDVTASTQASDGGVRLRHRRVTCRSSRKARGTWSPTPKTTSLGEERAERRVSMLTSETLPESGCYRNRYD